MATQSKAFAPIATPRNADGSLDTTLLVAEIGIRLCAFAQLGMQEAQAKHDIEKMKTAVKAIGLKKKDAKKAIGELLPQLRKAKVVIGSLKSCPNAQAIHAALPTELAAKTKANYLNALRDCLKNGGAFSTNPSRDKAAGLVKDSKDETKGILESHTRTSKLTAAGKLKLVMPELIKLATELNNAGLLECFEDAQEIISKLK